MSEVLVRVGTLHYTVEVESGLLAQVGDRLLGLVRAPRLAVVITDKNVARFHLRPVVASLRTCGFMPHSIVLPAGESLKSLKNAARLYDLLLAEGADRQTPIVALGGGVVGDLAGFVASTWLRGVPLVQVPTSLIGQVDSSVGGKVGVNHPRGKNLIGSFYHPRTVLADPAVLSTLPRRELVSGMAEVVKCGVIRHEGFFHFVERNVEKFYALDRFVTEEVIATCVSVKAEIVEKDEREDGIRAILNYGHTVGHALETIGAYRRFRHGEAIAIGMSCAARVALHLGLADAELVESQDHLLARLGLPTAVRGVRANAVLSTMRTDKKRRAGKVRMILPTQIGRVQIVDDVDPSALRSALSEVLK
ncbi:MAG: 3-dehydroquinate synthase [Planctomycetota bacterium]